MYILFLALFYMCHRYLDIIWNIISNMPFYKCHYAEFDRKELQNLSTFKSKTKHTILEFENIST